MARRDRLCVAVLALLAALGLPGGVLAAQDTKDRSDSRTEASQIELPADDAPPPGRAYLDPISPSPSPPPRRTSPIGVGSDQISEGDRNTPASQITSHRQGGSGMLQLSRAELHAALTQLSPVERRVLLQAIEGSDICNDPPQIAAIVTLCENRIETRINDFAARTEQAASAEDRLLSGDFERGTTPRIDQVIERLARSGASSGDPNNQAIAAIALGTTAPAPVPRREENQPEKQSFGEEAQALINALINQLGGRAP